MKTSRLVLKATIGLAALIGVIGGGLAVGLFAPRVVVPASVESVSSDGHVLKLRTAVVSTCLDSARTSTTVRETASRISIRITALNGCWWENVKSLLTTGGVTERLMGVRWEEIVRLDDPVAGRTVVIDGSGTHSGREN